MSDRWVITLMYGLAKNVYDGSVDRFSDDHMFEAITHLADALEPVIRTAARARSAT